MAKKDTEGGFVQLRSMPPENLAAIQSDLRSGRGLTAIARTIQGDWGLLTDMKENSLVKMLLRYRDKALVQPLAVALGGDSGKVNSLARKVESAMNALSGMEALVNIQMARIQELREKEKTLKMPFQWVSKEIETAATMLKDLQKMQIDTGIVEYRGPLLGKNGQAMSVVTPDGTTVTVGGSNDQLNSALSEAHSILSSLGVIDVEAKVTETDSDPTS